MMKNPRAGTYTARLLTPLVMMVVASTAEAADPAFETFRWNEDYRYLAEKAPRNTYESLKYQPFEMAGHEGPVSFGGSVRSRINAYDNDRFGLQDMRISISVAGFEPLSN